MVLGGWLLTVVYCYLRPLLKWVMRRMTKLCELQRICYGEPVGYRRSSGVERSIALSKSREIREMSDRLDELSSAMKLHGKCLKAALEYAANTVLAVKEIDPSVHRRFPVSFVRCVEHIWGYRQLVSEVESLRIATYDPANEQHEKTLLKLWSLLMPDVHLEARVTKQWQDIGFQGDDPKTDFRGMGVLGLDNLVFFAEEYPGAARHVLSHSQHPRYGYAFAVVGINLTSMAYRLLKEGALKTHVYNASKSTPALRLFHQLYAYLFYEFDRFWLQAEPVNIMDFAPIRDQFEAQIRTTLALPTSLLRVNITVDTV